MRTTGRTKPLIWMALATAFACFSWTASSDSAWGQSNLPDATAIGRAVNVSLLRVGLGGLGRVGCWIPIRLEAGGLPGGSEIRVVVVASDAAIVAVTEHSIARTWLFTSAEEWQAAGSQCEPDPRHSIKPGSEARATHDCCTRALATAQSEHGYAGRAS